MYVFLLTKYQPNQPTNPRPTVARQPPPNAPHPLPHPPHLPHPPPLTRPSPRPYPRRPHPRPRRLVAPFPLRPPSGSIPTARTKLQTPSGRHALPSRQNDGRHYFTHRADVASPQIRACRRHAVPVTARSKYHPARRVRVRGIQLGTQARTHTLLAHTRIPLVGHRSARRPHRPHRPQRNLRPQIRRVRTRRRTERHFHRGSRTPRGPTKDQREDGGGSLEGARREAEFALGVDIVDRVASYFSWSKCKIIS